MEDQRVFKHQGGKKTMLPIVVSSVLFCLVLKLAWAALSLSAKFIAVALYVVVVYLTANCFLRESGTYPAPREVRVKSKVHPHKQAKGDK